MIDPRNVINFNRTQEELEEFYLFCVCVAGKTAQTQARLLDNFLNNFFENNRHPKLNDSPSNKIFSKPLSPFAKIRLTIENGTLLDKLKNSKLGQYNRLFHSFAGALDLDLFSCTIKDLENIKGVGPKTARMFIMQTRANQHYAAIDTHILKYLKKQGISVPKSTPSSGKAYDFLEQKFLELAKKNNMTPADFDLEIWKSYQKIKDNPKSVTFKTKII